MDGSKVANDLKISESLSSFTPRSDWQLKIWKQLLLSGFPRSCDEDWRYTSLSSIKDKILTRPSEANNFFDPAFTSKLNLLDGYKLVFMNGNYLVDHSEKIPEITTYLLGAAESKDIISRSPSKDQEFFSQLTDATLEKTFLIEVREGTHVEKPLHIVFFDKTFGSEMSTSRIHISVGRGATLNLVEHHIGISGSTGTSLSRISAHLGDKVDYNHYNIINLSTDQQHFGYNDLSIGRNSTGSIKTFMLSGYLVRHHTVAQFNGEGSKLDIDSLALPNYKQTHDTRTLLKHDAPGCRSHQLHKIIASGDGVGVFDGTIIVGESAPKTNGQMDSHNLLLHNKATVNSKPKLEIYTDDVKCSHGCTLGELSPDQLFYLESRGITKQDAKRILIRAFAAEVCHSVCIPLLRTYLLHEIDNRIRALDNDIV